MNLIQCMRGLFIYESYMSLIQNVCGAKASSYKVLLKMKLSAAAHAAAVTQGASGGLCGNGCRG
jgi:hypothetical protein